MKHLNIKIYGRVQDVGFRFGAKKKADELGIKGFIKNEPDGTVYIEAEGDGNVLDNFLEWCRKGPRFASVERVEVMEKDFKGYEKFEIC